MNENKTNKDVNNDSHMNGKYPFRKFLVDIMPLVIVCVFFLVTTNNTPVINVIMKRKIMKVIQLNKDIVQCVDFGMII